MNLSMSLSGRLFAVAAILSVAVVCHGNEHRMERTRAAPTYLAGDHGQFFLMGWDCQVLFDASGVRFGAPPLSIDLRFADSSSDVRVEGTQTTPARVNYISAEAFRVRGWSEISYRGLYPGVDLHYKIARGRLKSEFVIARGADPGAIRLVYENAIGVNLGSDGAVIIRTPTGAIRESAPEVYQEFDSGRQTVAGAYRLYNDGSVGFQLGGYDPKRPLIIDPALSFSTYFGGADQDAATAVTTDRFGNAYVAGWSTSPDLPIAGGAQRTNAGGVDAFVAKISSSGVLMYCTYIGGSGDDRAYGIAVDDDGNAYLTGTTSSPQFPVAGIPAQSRLAGGPDAFVAKLSANGDVLIFSTYLGGSASDGGKSIAVDAARNIYVGGETASSNFPVLAAIQPIRGGQRDGFIVKLNNQGSAVLYGTYIGGSGDDNVAAIALDASANVHLTGGTTSTNFPVLSAAQSKIGGGQDAFAAKLDATGTRWHYITYLGGSEGRIGMPECGSGIAVDAAGNAYVTGTTSSANFPVSSAAQSNLRGWGDAFVTKFSVSGTLTYSTYLGGVGVDAANAIAVDAAGQAHVAGQTYSTDLAVTDAIQNANAGEWDAFIVKLSPSGSGVITMSYVGGFGSDTAAAVAVAPSGDWYVAGSTLSQDFPAVNALQRDNSGQYGAFLIKLASSGIPRSGTLTLSANPIQICDGAGLGAVGISWNATGVTAISLRVGSPNGAPLVLTAPPTGSGVTGKWVSEGLTFYLQDISGGLPLTAANTLATVTAHTSTAGCPSGRSGTLTLSANPIQICDGTGLGAVGISWSATGVTAISLRVGSPNGAPLVLTAPPAGAGVTGKWVSEGLAFYLQDISGGLPLTAANTLATVTAHTTTASCAAAAATRPNLELRVPDDGLVQSPSRSWNTARRAPVPIEWTPTLSPRLSSRDATPSGAR